MLTMDYRVHGCYSADAWDFCRNIFYSSDIHDLIEFTTEMAEEDIQNFRACEGWYIPDDLTPDAYADIMNALIISDARERSVWAEMA